jgi:hypothetical protein
MTSPDLIIEEPHDVMMATSTPAVAEEQARLTIGVFGRTSSIVFDIGSIIDLLQRDDQEHKEVLAHLLACSFAYIKA